MTNSVERTGIKKKEEEKTYKGMENSGTVYKHRTRYAVQNCKQNYLVKRSVSAAMLEKGKTMMNDIFKCEP